MMNGKNLVKRLSALFLCAVLFLTLLPVGGLAAFSFSPPTLVSLEKQGNSLVITWNNISGAPGYGVWRKTDGGSWQSVAQNVAGPSYKDTSITGGHNYTYTVRVVDGSGTRLSWFDEAGLSYYYNWPYATPVLTSGVATGNSFTVKWNAVAGAPYYAIYRKDNGSGWQSVKHKVTGTSYTDYNVKSGHTYTYTVRVEDANGKFQSWFDAAGVSGTVNSSSWSYATPVLKGATWVSGGVNITWNAVKNAPQYAVYRKTNGGGWQRIGTTTSTSYKDTTTNSGNSYIYTVRILDKDGRFASWFDETGVSPTSGGTYATPKLQSVTNTANGVNFIWDPVPGARHYRVFRRTNGGGWQAIALSVTGNSYLDRSVTPHTTYTYTARVVNDAGQIVSGFESPGLEIRYYPCANPNFTLTSTKEGMQITWNGVSGAGCYWIYRKNNGSWVHIGTTTGTSYVDKQVVSGKDYTYAVRCMSADGKAFLSWFNEKTATYYGEFNIITSLSYGGDATGRNIVVEWRDVPGAANYRIFRKANNAAEWKSLATVAASPRTYTDNQVVSGTTYTYTVRALDASGNFVGQYDSVGKSILYYDAPYIIEAVADNDGITVSWTPVLGINKYQVYRKITTAPGWDLIGSTSDLSFLDKNIVPQTEYQYTVRCMSNDGTTIVSGFSVVDRAKAKWLNTPVLDTIKLNENTVVLTWKQVDLADGYEILRKLNDEGWKSIGYVSPGTTTTYSDVFPNMVSGSTYWYTVRCVDTALNPTSNYDKDGLSISFYEVPKITFIENRSNGVYMEWNVTDGTTTYQVYRKNGDNNWLKVGTSNVTHFTDTTAVSSLTYVYAISSMDEGDNLLSDYFKDDRVSGEITYYKTPELVSVNIEGNGLRVKWAAVDGITDYRVYRKTVGVDGTDYFDVSAPEFYDTTVESGKTYTYTVRCIDGSGIVSQYESNLLKQLFLSVPVLGSISATTDSVSINWQAVVGANGYKIYRKDLDHAGWTYIGYTTGNIVDYKDTAEIRGGQDYVYTVRATYDGVDSDFDATGISVTTPLP